MKATSGALRQVRPATKKAWREFKLSSNTFYFLKIFEAKKSIFTSDFDSFRADSLKLRPSNPISLGRTHRSPAKAQSRSSRFSQVPSFTKYDLSAESTHFDSNFAFATSPRRAHPARARLRALLGPSVATAASPFTMTTLVTKARDLIWRSGREDSALVLKVLDVPTSDDEDSEVSPRRPRKLQDEHVAELTKLKV